MHFVYFIEPYSSDYVIFGRSSTKSFWHRIGTYRGSHPKIKVIGLQPVANKNEAQNIENLPVKTFEVTNPERSKCEMLWNCEALKDYITKNSVEVQPILDECKAYLQEYDCTRRERRRKNGGQRKHTQRERERRENEEGYREYLNANASAYRKRKHHENSKNQLTLFD